jgi:hypothetical protein
MAWTRLISWLTNLNQSHTKEVPLAMTAIEAVAHAIYIFEGGSKPTSRNNRNANPGNLRPYSIAQPKDGDNYRVFNHFMDGWIALEDDIEVKVKRLFTGTMVDFFNVYAPGADHNDPAGYAQFVCKWMTAALGREVTVASKIGDIFV